jgi:hypothetical protein
MEQLLNQEIIPDVLDSLPTSPKLDIIYDGNNIVNLGNQLKIKVVENAPTFVEWDADQNSYYTLCLTGM